MQIHEGWGIKNRSYRHAHACRAVILLASGRCRRMAPMTGALKKKDTGSLGRTGGEMRRACCSLCHFPAGVHGASPRDG